jgi:hypothetical protein
MLHEQAAMAVTLCAAIGCTTRGVTPAWQEDGIKPADINILERNSGFHQLRRQHVAHKVYHVSHKKDHKGDSNAYWIGYRGIENMVMEADKQASTGGGFHHHENWVAQCQSKACLLSNHPAHFHAPVIKDELLSFLCRCNMQETLGVVPTACNTN